MTNNIKATWKRLLSYTKITWDLDDYPLQYRKQTDIKEQSDLGELKPWVVQIVNWWTMTGLGDTKEEAHHMLKNNFVSYQEHNALPRPGTSVPLQFVDSTQIDELGQIAVEFFEKILDINFHDCFISDESSLMNFGRDSKETLDKINSVYNLGLTELGDGNLVRLLTIIKDKASAANKSTL